MPRSFHRLVILKTSLSSIVNSFRTDTLGDDGKLIRGSLAGYDDNASRGTFLNAYSP